MKFVNFRYYVCFLFLIPVLLMNCSDDDEGMPENGPIIDADGNEYTSVVIGGQEWMVENLKVTQLNDGTQLPEVQDESDWADLATPGYCWYSNDESENKDIYGALYNWRTVGSGKLCPSGWHVPTRDDWNALFDYLGDSAASKLKEAGNIHWSSSNADATNSTGFTALPGGFRETGEGFGDKGVYGYWWTSTEDSFDDTRALAREMNQFSRDGSQLVYDKSFGLSVRCIKD